MRQRLRANGRKSRQVEGQAWCGHTPLADDMGFRKPFRAIPIKPGPKCQSEYHLWMRAKRRLLQLLNEAPFDLRPINGTDQDANGRDLRVIVRIGRPLGDQLVNEGLA